MLLTKHQTALGSRYAVDGYFLPADLSLSSLLELPRAELFARLKAFSQDEAATGAIQAPIDPYQEVWASGVTYLQSRDARKAESSVAEVYQKVYDAPRPEIFSKSLGWRVVGDGGTIRIRKDSHWNVPEPEMVLVINAFAEIVGYCAGNDVSSRDIEGENPLYLPQAKNYNGACALGHGICLADPSQMSSLPIQLEIEREQQRIFSGTANTSMLKRGLQELTQYLTYELDFPHGVFLMTGTCLVPDNFTLLPKDIVSISVGQVRIQNPVAV